jgi:glycerol-3-phosphate cytidylyltransferase-like family protein
VTANQYCDRVIAESPTRFFELVSGVVKAVISITDDPETSERWLAELAAGKLPQTNENDT